MTKKKEAPESDIPFNGFTVARSPGAKDLVQEVLERIVALESTEGSQGSANGRKRARKPADQERFVAQVEALTCDLAYRHLTSPGRRISITRSKAVLSKRTRYSPQFVSEKLVDVMDALAGPELLICDIVLGTHDRRFDGSSTGRGKQTTLIAGPVLQSLIKVRSLAASDFGMHEDEEVIVLKRTKVDHWDDGGKIDYRDDARTQLMRSQVRQINRWLEAAHIDYEGSLPNVDINQRRLKRIFSNNSFEQHGRLHGAFWINLSSEDRRLDLTIDGSPVAALDYGQMAIRLLYAEAGVKPSFDDAYAVPGLERHREGVKRLLNAMLNTSGQPKRLPKGTSKLLPPVVRIGDDFVKADVDRLCSMLTEFHQPVAHLLHASPGLRLMFRESEIMIAVLLRLIDQGIVALPVHDGLLVPEENQEVAKKAMVECFAQQTGFPGVVSIE